MKYYAFPHTSGMNVVRSVSLAKNFDKKIQSVHVVKDVCTESRKNNYVRYCEWNDNFYIMGRMMFCNKTDPGHGRASITSQKCTLAPELFNSSGGTKTYKWSGCLITNGIGAGLPYPA